MLLVGLPQPLQAQPAGATNGTVHLCTHTCCLYPVSNFVCCRSGSWPELLHSSPTWLYQVSLCNGVRHACSLPQQNSNWHCPFQQTLPTRTSCGWEADCRQTVHTDRVTSRCIAANIAAVLTGEHWHVHTVVLVWRVGGRRQADCPVGDSSVRDHSEVHTLSHWIIHTLWSQARLVTTKA